MKKNKEKNRKLGESREKNVTGGKRKTKKENKMGLITKVPDQVHIPIKVMKRQITQRLVDHLHTANKTSNQWAHGGYT